MSKRGIFDAEYEQRGLILNFNNGSVGEELGNVSPDILGLQYTKHVPEHKITLKLSIWGGTTISFKLGFLTGGNRDDKYGYIFKSVSKEDWDKKSADWFDSLVKEGVENLQKNEDTISSGSFTDLPIDIGSKIVVNISKETLEKVLPELVNNFLKYNKTGTTYRYQKTMSLGGNLGNNFNYEIGGL